MIFPWVYSNNNPQLIDQSERAHLFGCYIKDNKNLTQNSLTKSDRDQPRRTGYNTIKFAILVPRSVGGVICIFGASLNNRAQQG